MGTSTGLPNPFDACLTAMISSHDQLSRSLTDRSHTLFSTYSLVFWSIYGTRPSINPKGIIIWQIFQMSERGTGRWTCQ